MVEKKADGYETIRVRAELKDRIIRAQNRHYEQHGKKVSVSALIEEAMDSSAPAADPDGVAPVLLDAYYNGDKHIKGQLKSIYDGWKPKMKREPPHATQEKADTASQRSLAKR